MFFIYIYSYLYTVYIYASYIHINTYTFKIGLFIFWTFKFAFLSLCSAAVSNDDRLVQIGVLYRPFFQHLHYHVCISCEFQQKIIAQEKIST